MFWVENISSELWKLSKLHEKIQLFHAEKHWHFVICLIKPPSLTGIHQHWLFQRNDTKENVRAGLVVIITSGQQCALYSDKTITKDENLPHSKILMKQVREENYFRYVSNTIRSHYAHSHLCHHPGIHGTTQSNYKKMTAFCFAKEKGQSLSPWLIGN